MFSRFPSGKGKGKGKAKAKVDASNGRDGGMFGSCRGLWCMIHLHKKKPWLNQTKTYFNAEKTAKNRMVEDFFHKQIMMLLLPVVKICISPSWTWNPCACFWPDCPFWTEGPLSLWHENLCFARGCRWLWLAISSNWQRSRKALAIPVVSLSHLVLLRWISYGSWNLEVW